VTLKIVYGSFEKRQKLIESYGKISLRRNELVGVINSSIGVVVLYFDVLIGLQKKRIDWAQLEDYSKAFGEKLSFIGETMTSLSLDFRGISSAIESQIPKKTSEEAYSILKAIYDYFESLSHDDDFKKSVLNFLSAKTIVLSYYTLNDLLLAKVVGDREVTKEIHQLESVLQILVNSTIFKIDIEALMISLSKVIAENDLKSYVEGSRVIFREALASFLVLNNR
jgi:hypothetical protein